MTERIKALEEEISFWKSMVSGYRHKQSAEEYMRIASALALAEHRLKIEKLGFEIDYEFKSIH